MGDVACGPEPDASRALHLVADLIGTMRDWVGAGEAALAKIWPITGYPRPVESICEKGAVMEDLKAEWLRHRSRHTQRFCLPF